MLYGLTTVVSAILGSPLLILKLTRGHLSYIDMPCVISDAGFGSLFVIRAQSFNG